jgi:ethanolaminephosphotransferase
MAKEPFELFWWPFTLLLVNLANTQLKLVNPALFAWACAGVALGGYLHYVFSVIDQICGFLGIHCLTIPGPSDGGDQKEGAVGSSDKEGVEKNL